MHPWHDVPLDAERLAEGFPVVVEVPRGSTNKYEVDKATGMLHLDRVLYSAVHYPADYGFVPRTLCGDGDALDVLVLVQAPVVPLTVVQARAIGCFRMRDEKGEDDKLIAVALGDPFFAGLRSHAELPPHLTAQIQRFFEDYKVLEHKRVDVDRIEGPDAALDVLRDAVAQYRAAHPDR